MGNICCVQAIHFSSSCKESPAREVEFAFWSQNPAGLSATMPSDPELIFYIKAAYTAEIEFAVCCSGLMKTSPQTCLASQAFLGTSRGGMSALRSCSPAWRAGACRKAAPINICKCLLRAPGMKGARTTTSCHYFLLFADSRWMANAQFI